MDAESRKLLNEMRQSLDAGNKEEFNRARTKTINRLEKNNLWDDGLSPDSPEMSEEQRLTEELSSRAWEKFYEGFGDDYTRREREAAKAEPRKRVHAE